MRTLIKNVHILTMDDQLTEYKNGYLLIEENRVLELGIWQEGIASAEEVIDGEGGILLPGFVNTHTHAGMIPFRSLGDDVPDRLRRFLFPLEAYMTPELVAASTAYAISEMLLSGVTGFCDMYYFEDQVAQVCDQFKIRAVLGETIIDMPVCDNPEPSGGLTYSETFLPKWQGHPLITPALAPHAPNTNTYEGLKQTVELSKRFDVPITLHVAEMDYEMKELAERYQQTPFELLKELGFMERPLIMAHCIHMTEADIALVAAAGEKVGIAHCIGANTKSAKGVAPVKEMLSAGLTVGLGTDGPSSGNTLDLFTQMKLFANFHKTFEKDRALFPAKEIVRLATRGGAELLDFKETGQLAVGNKADFIIVETQSVNMFPIFDPYSALVYSANASNVAHVWVDGKQLVRDHQLVHHDLKKIKANLYEQMEQFVFEAKQRM
ncbi:MULTISPECIES: amidohydrolase [unclassified Enterococcus]|uniref:amidohydrolase n=1 Tax=unclassified Enterococcus TaxID=2608891 RepID=UPI001A9268F0|nr:MULTISPECIES: amidohydrolase [unclassified Enterococcus]MBO0461230.1 amidohydrolase [Enterococcus sp. DIV1298c]MBO1299720.1 amidohydrolase [Enterococcus sp. DIV1271a]